MHNVTENTGARVLLLDIETAPIIAYQWQKSIWNSSVHLDQLIQDTYMLSFAAK